MGRKRGTGGGGASLKVAQEHLEAHTLPVRDVRFRVVCQDLPHEDTTRPHGVIINPTPSPFPQDYARHTERKRGKRKGARGGEKEGWKDPPLSNSLTSISRLAHSR